MARRLAPRFLAKAKATSMTDGFSAVAVCINIIVYMLPSMYFLLVRCLHVVQKASLVLLNLVNLVALLRSTRLQIRYEALWPPVQHRTTMSYPSSRLAPGFAEARPSSRGSASSGHVIQPGNTDGTALPLDLSTFSASDFNVTALIGSLTDGLIAQSKEEGGGEWTHKLDYRLAI